MPFLQTLEVRPSRELTLDEEFEMDPTEEFDGVEWNIFWGDNPLPWSTRTKTQAYAIALGCQWGAYEVLKEKNVNDERKDR